MITEAKRLELRRKRQARKGTLPETQYPTGPKRHGRDAHNNVVPGGARMLHLTRKRGTHTKTKGRWTDPPEWAPDRVVNVEPTNAHIALEGIGCNSQQHTKAPGTDRPRPSAHGMDLSWNDRQQHMGYVPRG